MSKKRRKQSSRTAKSRESAAKQKPASRRASTNLLPWIVAGAVVVALIAVAISLSQAEPEVTAGAYDQLPSDWVNRRVLGDPNAEVTLQVWEDFL